MVDAVWLWAGLALVLFIAEVFTGTLFLVFFGVAAAAVAVLKAAGLSHLAVEIFLFAGVGLGAALTLRKKVQRAFDTGSDFKLDQKLTLSQTLSPGESAQVEYQGTTWTAVNQSSEVLKKGEAARIAKIEGVTLLLVPLK